MRRFLGRIQWARIGCGVLAATSLALAIELRWTRVALSRALEEVAARDAEREKRLALLTSLDADLELLRAEFARQRRRERDAALQTAPAPPVATPSIRGMVVAIKADADPQLVLISVGSDDGVELGMHFSVFRGDRFVAKVAVEKVLRDSCGCRVLFTAEGEAVRSGDEAATRLN